MRQRIRRLAPLALVLLLTGGAPAMQACASYAAEEAEAEPATPNSPADSARPTPTPARQPARTCCRVCRAGKPCGDSCIAKSRTCRVGPGCACAG